MGRGQQSLCCPVHGKHFCFELEAMREENTVVVTP